MKRFSVGNRHPKAAQKHVFKDNLVVVIITEIVLDFQSIISYALIRST